MDEFELMYADELEAMEDLEEPEIKPASKRSLNFNSSTQKKPKESQQKAGLNLSADFTEIDDWFPDCVADEESKNGQSKRQLEYPTEADIEEFLHNDVPPPKRQKVESLSSSSSSNRRSEDWEVLPSNGAGGVGTPSQRAMPTLPGSQDVIIVDQQQQHQQQQPREQRVTYSIPRTNFMGITSTDGTRAYMKMRSCQFLEKQAAKVVNFKNSLQLLQQPFSLLMEKIAEEKAMKIAEEISLQESAAAAAAAAAMEADGVVTIGAVSNVEEGAGPATAALDQALPQDEARPAGNTENLWVDKYAPHSYAELLSEENINRSLLHWLKLWDHVVFNKAIKQNRKKTEAKPATGQFNKKKQQPLVSEELDKQNRPLQKIVLLNGAPGLGKTTLAHVIAKHAGYNVVEINASDDRSEEVMKTKIEAAILMKSVIEADPRPNCLIIDEIDGAPQAAINILLQLAKEGQTGKKKEKGLLLRPIICICNDLYVPSLRQLRPVSLIFTFPPTDPARLAGRLYQITRWEILKAEMNALIALCEKTDNDIRSCLNTLQFVQRQSREFTLRLVTSMAIGQKDVQRSLFSVWYDIFRLPRLKKSKYLTVQDLNNQSSSLQSNITPTARCQNILQATFAAGEFDKILQGLFQNYLQVKFKDPKMEGINQALDWLGFVDELNGYIHSLQDYTMMQYRPYLCVVFHFMFASNTHPKIMYPHQHTEMLFKKTRSENLVSSLLSDVHPAVRKYLHFSTVTQEVVQPLLAILQPALRPVNMQLYSNKEKECLRQLVNTMVAYNITYRQEKSPDGQYNYVLEPNIDEIVKFPGLKQQKQLTYATKQMIAREISTEKMRLADKSSVQLHNKNLSTAANTTTTTTTTAVPNHKQKLVPQAVTTTDQTERDFFGRVITTSLPSHNIDSNTERESNPLLKVIWFRFKEGFSNAVRRQVKIQDFL
ncbi:chromosome transmission fidelity protein 18 homolog [Argonauta hians]